MRNRVLNIVLAFVLTVAGVFGQNLIASAADLSLKWNVTYKGDENFEISGRDALKSKIENAMPGDNIEYCVTYTNDCEEAKNFYIDADVLSSLEDNSSNSENAIGGAYSFKVSYSVAGKDSVVIDSGTVGGDASVVKGLNQIASKGNYVSVGTLEAGQSGEVVISILLDGNSQDNSYMEKLAELKVTFAVAEGQTVEKHTDKTTDIVYTIPGGSDVIYIENDVIALTENTPKTGDSIMPLVGAGIAFVLGLFFIFLYFKTSRDEEEAA